MPWLLANTSIRCILGYKCDAWAGLEIESDRWNLLCKFTTVARDDSGNGEGKTNQRVFSTQVISQIFIWKNSKQRLMKKVRC